LTPDIFNLSPSDILSKFRNGAKYISALSLATSIPTAASLPHLVISTFKNLAAISLVTGYKFKQMDSLSAAPTQGTQAASAGQQGKAKEAPQVAEEPKQEEEDVEMGDLFGDDF